MKRYLSFYFLDYYPAGGWNDFIGSFDTAEDAFSACDQARRGKGDDYQVVDLETGKEVLRNRNPPSIPGKVTATMKKRLSDIGRTRVALIRNILRIALPHMRESGYRTGPDRRGSFANSRPLKIWVPRDRKGNPTNRYCKLGGYVVGEFMGLAEHGCITDDGGGMIVTTGFDEMPLEDLVLLNRWVEKRFPLPTANAA